MMVVMIDPLALVRLLERRPPWKGWRGKETLPHKRFRPAYTQRESKLGTPMNHHTALMRQLNPSKRPVNHPRQNPANPRGGMRFVIFQVVDWHLRTMKQRGRHNPESPLPTDDNRTEVSHAHPPQHTAKNKQTSEYQITFLQCLSSPALSGFYQALPKSATAPQAPSSVTDAHYVPSSP